MNGDTTAISQALNLVPRLADRVAVSPEEFIQLLSERSALYGKPLAPPTPPEGLMWNQSYFVSNVDDQFRRDYLQNLTTHSSAAVSAETVKDLEMEFSRSSLDGASAVTMPTAAAKPARASKASKMLNHFTHPLECVALPKILLPSPLGRKLLSTAVDCSLLATFATGVHRLSVCSAIDSCQLFSADGVALLVASGAMHTLRVVKGDKWVQHALGFNRDDELDTPPTSPRNRE